MIPKDPKTSQDYPETPLRTPQGSLCNSSLVVLRVLCWPFSVIFALSLSCLCFVLSLSSCLSLSSLSLLFSSLLLSCPCLVLSCLVCSLRRLGGRRVGSFLVVLGVLGVIFGRLAGRFGALGVVLGRSLALLEALEAVLGRVDASEGRPPI